LQLVVARHYLFNFQTPGELNRFLRFEPNLLVRFAILRNELAFGFRRTTGINSGLNCPALISIVLAVMLGGSPSLGLPIDPESSFANSAKRTRFFAQPSGTDNGLWPGNNFPAITSAWQLSRRLLYSDVTGKSVIQISRSSIGATSFARFGDNCSVLQNPACRSTDSKFISFRLRRRF
jgi:hypothetical protein